MEKFPESVTTNKGKRRFATPGGPIAPKFCLWLTFPTKLGRILRAKMYLLEHLPVNILADLNMLRAFGYKFKDGVPPIFTHDEEDELDDELPEDDEIFSNNNETNWYNEKLNRKQTQLNCCQYNFSERDIVTPYDRIYGGGCEEKDIVYDSQIGSVTVCNLRVGEENITVKGSDSEDVDFSEIEGKPGTIGFVNLITQDFEEKNLDVLNIKSTEGKDNNNINIILDELKTNHERYDIAIDRGKFPVRDVLIGLKPIRNGREILNINTINSDELKYLNSDVGDINSVRDYINGEKPKRDYYKQFTFYDTTNNKNANSSLIYHAIDRFGKSRKKCPIYHKCMFLMSRQSFLASEEEKIEAAKILENKILKWNDLSYLKQLEIKFGENWKDSFQRVTDWMKKYGRIFAKRTFSRRTMNVEPAKLGIKPEHRNKVMYAAQYPISATKRLHMINYTTLNEQNGFWRPIKHSVNCVPYTMVPKKKNGIIVRYRPAFDGRIVNQYCALMIMKMPTIQHFMELHAQRALTTQLDCKNMFDNIPLWKPDWKFAVAHTPLGLYQMMHMTYGWMNAAPEAQKIMNQLAMEIGNSLAYIDDLSIKHKLEDGIDGAMEDLERLAQRSIERNILWNPTKFFPLAMAINNFGFHATMVYAQMSEAYKRKILSLATPRTRKDLRNIDGILNYMNRCIYEEKIDMHWLNKMKEEFDKSEKVMKLVWTKEARLAWAKLRESVRLTPKLYHPTIDGQFAIQTDACNYAVGAVLWQEQDVNNNGELKWVMIDMWSKTLPKALQTCHSIVLEAYAVSSAIIHWAWHLIRAKFIISTDNMPIARIFGQYWKDLSPITHRQLARLKQRVSAFSFESYHVKGIHNTLADALSRFVARLVTEDEQRPIEERLYPTEAKAIPRDDPQLPTISKRALDEIQRETDRIYKNLTTKKNTIPTINNLRLTPQSVSIESGLSDKIENYKNYCKDVDSAWNQMLIQFSEKGDISKQDKLNEFINCSSNLLRRDESSIDYDFNNIFENKMINTMLCMGKMTDELLNIVGDMTQRDEQIRDYEYLLLSETREPTIAMINALDKEYDIEEDLPTREDRERELKITGERAITRSMTQQVEKKKKIKQQQEQKESESDSNQDIDSDVTVLSEDDEEMNDDSGEEREVPINVEFEIHRDYMKTREEFMYEIFGHRHDMDIMSLDVMKVQQRADNTLELVRKLVHLPKEERDLRDLQYLKKWDSRLLNRLQRGLIRQDCNLLEINSFDPSLNKRDWKIIIPIHLRGKLIEYAHHNLHSHHHGKDATYARLRRAYWWSTMRKDVNMFCKRCISCQFVNGSMRHRSPLTTRTLCEPGEHLVCDFAGPFLGTNKMTMVMVDRATGYIVLETTEGCDAVTIINVLMKRWVPIFGWFSILETDWGSGFTNKLVNALSNIVPFSHEITEPYNHRGTSLAERSIGTYQRIMNHYNLLLDEQLTDRLDRREKAIKIIDIITKMIQFGMNNKSKRFTNISPNQLMFGRNMNDMDDAARLNFKLQQIQNNKQYKLKQEDYNYLRELIDLLNDVRKRFKDDWIKYTFVSKRDYEKRYNITKELIERNLINYAVGTQVLYYVGDKQVAMHKWKSRWTGPWIVEKHINDSSLILADPESGDQKRVSFDRIKKFNSEDFMQYQDLVEKNEGYLEYQRELLKRLKGYNVKKHKRGVDLDYTKYN